MTESTSEYKKRIEEIKQSIENEPYMAKMREDIAEGISKTGIRQATVEEQFQSVLDETTGKDVISAPEIIDARNGKSNLKTRLDDEHAEVTAQLAQKAKQSDLETERARITNLAALSEGSTTGDAELMDGRIGADGVSYENIGDAIRGQTSKLKDKFDDVIIYNKTGEVYSNLLDGVAILNGYTLNTSGVVQSNASYSTSDFIDVSNCNVFRYFNDGSSPTKYSDCVRAFYDADQNYIEGSYAAGGTSYDMISVDGKYGSYHEKPQGAKYYRYSAPTATAFNRFQFLGVTALKEYKLDGEYYEKKIAAESGLKNKGYEIVNLGDSLFGNATYISDYLAQFTGATVHNCACGGTLAATRNDVNYNRLCFSAIADAIASNNYTDVIAAVTELQPSAQSVINIGATLPSIDFSKIDIITLHYGTNDFSYSKTLDNISDKYDKSTLMGALRYGIETIGAAYPNIRFVIDTPMWRMTFINGVYSSDCDTDTDYYGKYLYQYADAIMEIAKEYHIPCCDFFNEIGLNKYNWQIFFTPNDGTHPNQNGRKLMAKKLSGVIANL